MAGYCVVHLLEHTINSHFHYGEETHHDEFVSARTGYSVLGGLSVHALFDGVASARDSSLQSSGLAHLSGSIAAQGTRRFHHGVSDAGQRTQPHRCVLFRGSACRGYVGVLVIELVPAGCPMVSLSPQAWRCMWAQATWYPRSTVNRAFAWRWSFSWVWWGFC